MRRLWLAVALGLGGFFALALALPGRGPLGIDRAGSEAMNTIRGSSADGLARGLTRLGAAYVAWPVALLGCLALAVERRRRAAAGMLLGAVAAVVAVGIAKDLIGRPRPPGSLVATAGQSFPSGHATYATYWAAIALLLAAGRKRRRLLVAVGVAVMLVVGATRIYLRAHYVSDVLAGWGVSSALLALGLLAAQARRSSSGAGEPSATRGTRLGLGPRARPIVGPTRKNDRGP